jgi:broad specificity phosphatase PhoE
VLIVADLSVLQCIYAYFLEIPNKEIPNVEMPLGTMVELKPKAYGVFERRISVDTDTMSPKESEFRPFT